MPMELDAPGPRCAKYTLYIVNVLIIILGCVTITAGCYMRTDVNGFLTPMNPSINPFGNATAPVPVPVTSSFRSIHTVANIVITSGVFALLVGLLGVWAAYKQSKSYLIAYVVIVTVVVLMEVGVGIAWAAGQKNLINGLTLDYRDALSLYDYVQTTTGPDNQIVVVPNQILTRNRTIIDATAFINMLQTWVGCCGYDHHGFTDFRGSPYWNKIGEVAPVFCCKLINKRELILLDPSCAIVRDRRNSWENVGCRDKITLWIDTHSPSIIGVAVGIGLINLIGIMAAVYQYIGLKRGYKEF